jgi:hypothetical protein
MDSLLGSHNCPYSKGLNWYTYQTLEKKVLEISRIVAIDNINKTTWSEDLANLLILVGSSVDSFFRDMELCSYIQNKQSFIEIKEKIESKKKKTPGKEFFWGIGDFYNAYNPIYDLSDHFLIVNPISLSNYDKIKPFENFNKFFKKKEKNQKGEEVELSTWWHDYNGLKHSYYQDFKKRATLENVLEALGSLFLLNCLHVCSQIYLIKNKYFKVSHGSYIDDLREDPFIYELIKSPYYGYNPPNLSALDIFLQTNLFRFEMRKHKP